MAVDAGVDHAGAGDLDPAALLADPAPLAAAEVAGEVDLDARLGEGEEVGAEAHADLRPHHLAGEGGEGRLEVGQRDGAGVDVESLDLVEVGAVGGVGRVAPVAASRGDDAHGGLAAEQHADLHGRGLGAQEQVVVEPEGVGGVHRRVVRGGVERREVVEARLDVGPVGDGEAEAPEDAGHLVDHARDGVLGTGGEPASGERGVEGGAGAGRPAVESLAARGEGGLDGLAPGVGLATEGRAFRGGHFLELLHDGGEQAVAAEVADAGLFERGGRLRLADGRERFGVQRG